MNFGDELKRIRESKGMTVNQLAVYSGISAASISRYETGERGIPKPKTIEKLAKGLKVDYMGLMHIAGHTADEEDGRDPIDKLVEYLDVLGLTNEEIIKKLNFKVDEIPLSDDEADEFIEFVRWQRSKKKRQPAVSSKSGVRERGSD